MYTYQSTLCTSIVYYTLDAPGARAGRRRSGRGAAPVLSLVVRSVFIISNRKISN